jgi:hypothetical protein
MHGNIELIKHDNIPFSQKWIQLAKGKNGGGIKISIHQYHFLRTGIEEIAAFRG